LESYNGISSGIDLIIKIGRGAIVSIPNDIKVTVESLKKNGFNAEFASSRYQAKEMMLEMIPLDAVVGVADSVTLRQVDVLKELIERGNKVLNPFTQEMTRNMFEDSEKRRIFLQTLRSTFGTDVFVTGCNAVTEDGKLVSVDAAGNRVAGIIYAAPKVILVIGKNKIVKDTGAAINRIKNVIAPVHAKQRNHKTPCAVTGECVDCNHPERICNVTIILEKEPYHTEISIILINEDMGLGWSPDWNEKRIKQIKLSYQENSWLF
jgi:L-lactate utilization protein LutB